MKNGARLLRRTVTAVAGLLVIVAVGVAIVIHTAGFREFLRVRIVSYLNQTYRGRFAIAQVEGSILGTLTLRDLSLGYDESPALSVPVLRLRYRLAPLLSGHVDITLLMAEAPALDLARLSDGEWNLLAVFSERNPKNQHRGFAVGIDRLALERGEITVSEPDARKYRLQDVRLGGAAEFGPSGTRVALNQLAARLIVPGLPDTVLQGGLAYSDIGNPGGSIRVSDLSLKTRNSGVTVSGAVRDLSTKSVDATVAINRLAATDVDALMPRIGLAQDLSGTVRIVGDTLAALRVEATISAGGSRLDAHVLANLAQPEPIYNAGARLEALNPQELLKSANGRALPGGVINGTLRINGRGKDVAGASAQTVLRDQGVSVNGLTIGDLSLTASFERGVAAVSATLASGKGEAHLEGKIDTAGQTNYQLRLTVNQLELRRLGSNLGIPAGNLNLTADVDGAGLTPSAMRTTARISLLRSVIGPATIDRGQLDARISGGIVRIVNGDIKAQQSTLSVRGEIAFANEQRGSLHYAADVRNLAPWLALAGRQGGGSVNLAGDAAGNLHRLRVAGSAKLSALHFKKYSARQGKLSYELDGTAQLNTIRGRIALALTDLRAGIELKSVAAQIRLQPGKAEIADVSVDAAQTPSRAGTLAAEVSYQPRRISVSLQRLSITTDAGTWRLNGPAGIIREDGKLSIRGLRLDNDGQSVSIDGVLSDHGAQDLSARIERLRLSALSPLMPKQPKLQGIVSAQLKARGTAAAPAITLAARLNDLRVEGVRYQSLSANLEYAGTRASLAMTLMRDSAHRLEVSGFLPAHLSWAQGFEYRATGDVDLEAKSTGLDLAFVDAFGGGTVSKVAGTLSLDLTVRGPIRHPRPNGFVELSGGQFLLKPLGVQVQNATARIAVAPQEVRLVSLSLAAQGGTITGGGMISLAGITPERMDLKVTFDKWPAIETANYEATIAGVIGCSGPLNALQVRGRTEVLYGVIRPELELLGAESLKPDRTIKVARSWKPPTQTPDQRRSNTAAFSTPKFNNIAINLDVIIHRDTWIKTADSAVELEGKIHVAKPARGKPILSGTINSVRGNLTVVGKTFTLSRGQIIFTGGQEIDPSLDLAAAYAAPSYDITAAITGTAKKPVLALSSTPDLTQADILAVLMFGKPVNQLTASQQNGLQQEALSMASGYVAAQVGKSIAQALGLEALGVNVSQSGVGFGNYLTKNVYVSASQETNPSAPGRAAALTYYLTPHLELETSASTNSSVGNQIELNWKKEY